MKKKRQHFIPETYLKRFSNFSNGETNLVYAYDKVTTKISEGISTKDICVEKDLYTYKDLHGSSRYNLENFFSQTIESKYPSVYKKLVIEKEPFISPEERAYILLTTLSLYFRTPRLLNEFAKFSTEIINQIRKKSEPDYINFLGSRVFFKDKSFSEIKNEIKESHRPDYLKAQIALLNKFIEFKSFDGLVVHELFGDQEFITSDNPVIIGNPFKENFNLFDYGNSVFIPLDPKHGLSIMPKGEGSIINKVIYQKDDFFLHFISNSSVFENAERWVIGTQKGVTHFFKDLNLYNRPFDKDHPVVVKYKEKLALMAKLNYHIEKGISNENFGLINYLKEINSHKLFEECIDIRDAYESLKGCGLNVK